MKPAAASSIALTADATTSSALTAECGPHCGIADGKPAAHCKHCHRYRSTLSAAEQGSAADRAGGA